jgi:hypothetical protein
VRAIPIRAVFHRPEHFLFLLFFQRKGAISRSASADSPKSNSAVMAELMNRNGSGFKGKSSSVAPAPSGFVASDTF